MFTVTAQDRHGVMQVGMLDIKGNEQVRRVYSDDGVAPTLNTMQGGNRQPKVLLNYRIRKLTPTECFLLQGFTKADIDKCIDAGISNTQLYKQAGNSIGVTLLVDLYQAIFDKYDI